ncbi:MAG: cell division protein FtsZ [Deltaproteobacteria bacterium]|nr:MAG: cell division protein FtsZ [Deltaproteobacteria bacterium]
MEPRFDIEEPELQAKIKVIGVGGGGGNAINNMVVEGLEGVEFIAANTDAKALRSSKASITIQLGVNLTKGLGAGGIPDIGCKAAQEDADKIAEVVDGADMVFITAGLGGGTGTGAAPVIANICKEAGALTVAVVTKPFSLERNDRMRKAEQGIIELKKVVDTLITIPNDRLLSLADKRATLLDMFKKVDDVLMHAVKGIADLITHPGLINVDFADVKTVMGEAGMAIMGTGIGKGENRAIEAAEQAISNPLLEDVSIEGATALLLNITAGPNLTLYEFKEASSLISKEVDEDAKLILGTAIDPNMDDDELRITVIATGIGHESNSVRRRMRAREQRVIRPVPTSGEREHSELDHLRRSRKLGGSGVNPEAKDSEEGPRKRTRYSNFTALPIDESELDIPTFLRQQAD